MTIKKQLIEHLATALKNVGVYFVPTVDYPDDPRHGDYATNVALVAAKKLGKQPMELGEELKKNFLALSFIERIEVVKPGFINFWISYKALLNEKTIANIGKGKAVIVEYSSPNIAKPFTIGHLRSTIIGDAIANLLEATGWDVKRDNHIGDWGTQFGKQIYAIKHWGNEEEIEQSKQPVKLLVELYIKFHDEAEKNPQLEDEAREWFKKLEDGDPEARRLWQKCITWSWNEFDHIYTLLNVSFTENKGKGYGESFFEDKMSLVVDELKEKELLKEGENGAKLVFFPNDELPPLMILKQDGASLYATRDLATDKFRLDTYGKDVVIINEVGTEQSLYFKQLFKLEEMLGWVTKNQRIHVKHGLYRFKEGKMSTRKGNVIWLKDVLEEAGKRAFAIMDEAKKQLQLSAYEQALLGLKVGIGAIKWSDLKRSAEQDITFDWDDMLTMQGNSGPYIQYTYARTQSVLRKDQTAKIKQQKLEEGFQLEVEEHPMNYLLSL